MKVEDVYDQIVANSTTNAGDRAALRSILTALWDKAYEKGKQIGHEEACESIRTIVRYFQYGDPLE